MNLRLAAGLALGIALPAQAYMAPQYYVEMRAAAPTHIQVRVASVAPSPAREGFGDCLVTGEVAAIFRDRPKSLRPGETIAFGIPCQVRKNAPVPVGGTAWRDYERLRGASVVEVFLRREGAAYVLADQGDGVRLLDAPTATPTVVDQR